MDKMIPLFKVYMAEEIDKPLLDVIHSGWIGEGPKVEEFEKRLKEYFSNPYISTLNNGTSALHLAYHMSLYPDSPKSYKTDSEYEIISTAITCTATNTPIITNGAKIVWADVDPISGNIDPEDIERKITPKTRAVVMVHWGGNPCEIDRINEIGRKYGIKVIEDAAHAIGSEYKGKRTGNFSDFTAVSLQAIKTITSVDGGLLMMKNEKDYDRARLLRWYGIDRTIREGVDLRCELDVVEAGYKFHMNDVSATIGMVNFEHIGELVSRSRANAAFYDQAFAGHDAITVAHENPDGKSSYWLYTLHVNNRDAVMKELNNRGIMSSKVHARNDTHTMFNDFKIDLPNAEKFNQTHLCIPVGWWVTDEDRDYIADNVIRVAESL